MRLASDWWGVVLEAPKRVLSAARRAANDVPGWRPLVVGVVGECAIAGLTLAPVLGAARWLA